MIYPTYLYVILMNIFEKTDLLNHNLHVHEISVYYREYRRGYFVFSI